MQRDCHDFGGEAEGIFHTWGSWEHIINQYRRSQISFVSYLRTVSVMQVHVHVKDSLVLLPQFENSQHGVVHVTEARRFVPGGEEGNRNGFIHRLSTATAPPSGDWEEVTGTNDEGRAK